MPVSPIPQPTENLKTWAANLVGYLRSLEAAIEKPSPKIIQLEHQTASSPIPSATQDGILMWRTADSVVVVSKGETWEALLGASDDTGTDYLPLTGGTLTGALTLSGLYPIINFIETDQVSPAGRFRLVGDGGAFTLRKNTAVAGNFSTEQILLSVTDSLAINVLTDDMLFPNSDILSATSNSVVVRKQGDARYVMKTGGASQTINTTILYLDAAGEGGQLTLRETGSGKSGSLDMVAADNYMRIYHDMGGTFRQWQFKSDGALNAASFEASGMASVGGVSITATTAVGITVIPLAYNSSNYAAFMRGKSAGENALLVRGDGMVLFPVTYGSFTSAVAANMVIGGGGDIYRSTSRGKYKTNIALFDAGLDIIAALRPVYFDSTHEVDEGIRFAGFIAEEVAVAFPEAEADGGENYDVRAIVAALVAAVQNLTQRIETLEGAQP